MMGILLRTLVFISTMMLLKPYRTRLIEFGFPRVN